VYVKLYWNPGIVCFYEVDAALDELTEVSDDGQQKRKKLVPFQSRYSDTDGEETTEQCRARVVCLHNCT